MRKSYLAGAGLAAMLALGAGAMAQDRGPGPMPGPGGDPAAMHSHWEAHKAAHAKALHDVLNIHPDQEAAFSAYVASMEPPARGDGKDRHPPQASSAPPAMTAPERLDRMGREMDAHMQRMKAEFARHADATKAFYAALSPDQRKAFDALPLLSGHGAMMGRRGRHGGE